MGTSSQSTRRRFLKAAGSLSTVGIASVAGCLGGNGGSGNSGGSSNNSGGSGNSGGPSVEYWEYFYGESQVADDLLKSSVKSFEKKNNVQMDMNWSNYDAITSGKWKSNIQSGNRPVLYDSTNSHDGQFIKPGWVKPVNEYIDKLDDDAVKNAKAAWKKAHTCYRGFDADLYEIPIGMEVGSPFIVRTDHFKKAGLDIEKDFPPKDYDHLVQVAKQLQKNGPGEYGFQIYGSQGDVTDEALVTWTVSEGGQDGLYLNKDWSDVNYDNDVWKTQFKKYVDLFEKYGLSSKKAPNTSDEGATQMVLSGQVSMAQVSPKDFGLIRSRGKQMLKDGTIRFGPSWKGKAGNRGEFFTQCVAVLNPPKGANKKKWKKKQEVAYEWINYLLSKKFQKQVPVSLGTVPVRKDVQQQITGNSVFGKSHFAKTLKTMFNDIDLGWASQQDMNAIQYNIAGPIFQKAVLGDITPEQACNKAAKQIRNQVL